MKPSAMSRPRPQWQLQALAAHRRDTEIRRAEELERVAQYFEKNTRASKHHEQWTTQGYYERANKEAELLSEKKIRKAKLTERRKKLELMLFQENMQYQQELKTLHAKPKFFKNGSYLNNVSTATLEDINQGIKDKEEQLRRHEAELRLHHAWRAQQPELRAAESYIRNGRCKSSWMEQMVEKEQQKKKDEEETRRILKERDESVRRQIQIEKERLKEKEQQMKELRSTLEGQIAELSDREKEVSLLKKEEERQMLILEQLKLISKERAKEHEKLTSGQNTSLINMGLHKHKLRQKVLAVLREIDLELTMLDRIKLAVMKDYSQEQDKCEKYKRALDAAHEQLVEQKAREDMRRRTIEALYDGEARQMSDKQDKMWATEREARASLMREVISTLQRQLQQKIDQGREQQKENVLEREQILNQVDSFHQEVRAREHESQYQNSTLGNINALQSQLNQLRVQKERLDEKVAIETSVRETIANEGKLRRELVKMHREGVGDLPAGRKVAW